jgi:hypothetical protein
MGNLLTLNLGEGPLLPSFWILLLTSLNRMDYVMGFDGLILLKMIDDCNYSCDSLRDRVLLKSPGENARSSSINQMYRYQYS